MNSLLNAPLSKRTVAFSSDLTANDVVRSAGRRLGNFKLTFYCPCVRCNGRSDGLTRSGTIAQEGRTIAVDPKVIPLGSRVYIDGYGVFIAEDTGGRKSTYSWTATAVVSRTALHMRTFTC